MGLWLVSYVRFRIPKHFGVLANIYFTQNTVPQSQRSRLTSAAFYQRIADIFSDVLRMYFTKSPFEIQHIHQF